MRNNTYYVIINVKNKKGEIRRIKCGSKDEINKRLTQLHSKGVTSYTFTLMKNGLRYKEFNFVKSMVDFIKFLPLIKEEN